jgi:hypothetical protein
MSACQLAEAGPYALVAYSATIRDVLNTGAKAAIEAFISFIHSLGIPSASRW